MRSFKSFNLFTGLLALVLCGCAAPRAGLAPGQRHFDFQKDTFAYPNELLWIYEFDANGKWVSHRRDPKPDYWLRCFVVARSARQFYLSARFDPNQRVADESTYRRLIRKVVSSNPRRALPDEKKIVIPGYANLRAFSQSQEPILKAECGGPLQSYFQRGHWRMVLPFSRKGQEETAGQLLSKIQQHQPVVVHIVRFPKLSINHALVLFGFNESPDRIEFLAYDPNEPKSPSTLTFNRATRTFTLPANHYFPGGRVDVYEVYHRWNY